MTYYCNLLFCTIFFIFVFDAQKTDKQYAYNTIINMKEYSLYNARGFFLITNYAFYLIKAWRIEAYVVSIDTWCFTDTMQTKQTFDRFLFPRAVRVIEGRF